MEAGGSPPEQQPYAYKKLTREEQAWLSRKYHKRVRAATNVTLGLAFFTCLTFDWDTYLGTDKHVFRHIRPGIRSVMDWMYGVAAPQAPKEEERQGASPGR